MYQKSIVIIINFLLRFSFHSFVIDPFDTYKYKYIFWHPWYILYIDILCTIYFDAVWYKLQDIYILYSSLSDDDYLLLVLFPSFLFHFQSSFFLLFLLSCCLYYHFLTFEHTWTIIIIIISTIDFRTRLFSEG